MTAIALVAFVFGVFGLIAFGQVQALRNEVRELKRRIDEGFAED